MSTTAIKATQDKFWLPGREKEKFVQLINKLGNRSNSELVRMALRDFYENKNNHAEIEPMPKPDYKIPQVKYSVMLYPNDNKILQELINAYKATKNQVYRQALILLAGKNEIEWVPRIRPAIYDEILINAKEACVLTGRSYPTIHLHARKGDLGPYSKLGDGPKDLHLFKLSNVANYFNISNEEIEQFLKLTPEEYEELHSHRA